MSDRYTRVDESYDGESPSGSGRDGYTIYHETDEYLLTAILAYISHKENDRWLRLKGKPEITVHHCWSGYSEYTITSAWDEISVEWDGRSFYWEHIADFFNDLARVPKEYFE